MKFKQFIFGEYGLVRDTEHLKKLITKYKTVKFSVEIDFVVIFKRASLTGLKICRKTLHGLSDTLRKKSFCEERV